MIYGDGGGAPIKLLCASHSLSLNATAGCLNKRIHSAELMNNGEA
jgi:hypothetical protein